MSPCPVRKTIDSAGAAVCQAGLQLESVQPGHLQIKQDTAGFDGGQPGQELSA